MRDEIIRVIVLLYCKDVPVEQANREFCLDNWKKISDLHLFFLSILSQNYSCSHSISSFPNIGLQFVTFKTETLRLCFIS